MNGGPQARVSSPVLERSTLITSAPRSASTWPAHGPARIRANSNTRTPANGPGMGSFPSDKRAAKWAANAALCGLRLRFCLWVAEETQEEKNDREDFRRGARHSVPQGAQFRVVRERAGER